jgi:plasmid stability protein
MKNDEGKVKMAVLQVRTMDDDLYEALGRRAAMDNRSISQEVITIIKEFLSKPVESHSTDAEGLKLAGAWVDERSAEEIVDSIRSARKTARFSGEF